MLSQAMAQRIEHWKLADLTPYPKNPRRHSDAQIAQIAEPISRAADIWCIAGHRLACGDCRDRDVVHRLFDGARANLVITSPPYASQREYDPESGFTPVPPDEYSGWFPPAAENIAAVLAPDGSYCLNIKPHADEGERTL